MTADIIRFDPNLREVRKFLDRLHAEREGYSPELDEDLRRYFWPDDEPERFMPNATCGGSLTTSLENAIFLVGQALPGWEWVVSTKHREARALVYPDLDHFVFGARFRARIPDWGQNDPWDFWGTQVEIENRERPALALCEAVFAAKLMILSEVPNLYDALPREVA